MAETLGTIGEQIDLQIRKGATFGPISVTMTDNATPAQPINLTDCSIRGNIRKTALAEEIIVPFSIEITNPTHGQWTFSLADDVTNTINCGLSPTDAASQYFYNLEIEWANGTVMPLYYGHVTVYPGINFDQP